MMEKADCSGSRYLAVALQPANGIGTRNLLCVLALGGINSAQSIIFDYAAPDKRIHLLSARQPRFRIFGYTFSQPLFYTVRKQEIACARATVM